MLKVGRVCPRAASQALRFDPRNVYTIVYEHLFRRLRYSSRPKLQSCLVANGPVCRLATWWPHGSGQYLQLFWLCAVSCLSGIVEDADTLAGLWIGVALLARLLAELVLSRHERGVYQPIWRIRSRMSAPYLFMRSGRRFSGAGRIAASRAASSRLTFRAAIPS